MTSPEIFMKRAFDLAVLGVGSVSPNPLVGCVIVKNGMVIGEGYHQQFGGPHAEVNAVNSVDDKSQLSGSQVFVSLEPCPHQGLNPPCADLLVKHQVGEVFISNIDPNPLVNGKGIKKLKEAGISVKLNIRKEDGQWLNRRFFKLIDQKRPYVILKWAQTADRYMAREDNSSKWISDEHSRSLVHKWRHEEDAIMVGTNTAMIDNPQLNVRGLKGVKPNHPLRIIIDRHLKLSKELYLFDGAQATICFNTLKNLEEGKNKVYPIGR